ncbi:MAG TPA: Uma2 family endonuclease [Firmicutes bacterium]|nr:Uma2 family endonuclease [Bacillota bacterium]
MTALSEPPRLGEVVPKYLSGTRPGSSGGRFTYEDYCRLPVEGRYELVEGDIRMAPSPSVLHQEISIRLAARLLSWVDEHALGKVYLAPLDVVLDRRNVLQPDISYVSAERLAIIQEANIVGPPDLVVEILSSSDPDWDRVTKRAVYARHGVREYWLVDPVTKAVEVTRQQDGQLVTAAVYVAPAAFSSPLLPGLTVDLEALFRP